MRSNIKTTGPTEVVIEDSDILYDSVYLPHIRTMMKSLTSLGQTPRLSLEGVASIHWRSEVTVGEFWGIMKRMLATRCGLQSIWSGYTSGDAVGDTVSLDSDWDTADRWSATSMSIQNGSEFESWEFNPDGDACQLHGH